MWATFLFLESFSLSITKTVVVLAYSCWFLCDSYLGLYVNTSDLLSLLKPQVFRVGQRVDNKGSIVEGTARKEHE